MWKAAITDRYKKLDARTIRAVYTMPGLLLIVVLKFHLVTEASRPPRPGSSCADPRPRLAGWMRVTVLPGAGARRAPRAGRRRWTRLVVGGPAATGRPRPAAITTG